MSEQDFCTDCAKPKRFTRRWFNKTALGGALVAVGVLSLEKAVIRNAFTDDKTVPLNQQELEDWITTPGLIDSYPVEGLPQEQQDAIKEAIKNGDTTFFTEHGYGVFKEAPKPGEAAAACSYYYTLTPISCCTSRYCRCYRCNGETQWCSCSISGGYNNCYWCGSGNGHCCG